MFQADRYANLRELLKRPIKGTLENVILLLREIGYAVLTIADDIAALRSVPAAIAKIEKGWLEYTEDSLEYRKKRLEAEGDDDGVMSTQDAIQKIQERYKRLNAVSAAANAPTVIPAQPQTAKPTLNWSQIFSALVGAVLTVIVLKLLDISF